METIKKIYKAGYGPSSSHTMGPNRAAELFAARTKGAARYRVTLYGGAVNVLLLAFKFTAGIVGHSAAMVADAVHSLSDFVTDIIVLAFVHISSKPEDRSHEYGHGKYETLALTIIGFMLLAVAVGIVYGGLVKIVVWAGSWKPRVCWRFWRLCCPS